MDSGSPPKLSSLLERLASFGADCDRRLAQIERRFQRLDWEEPQEESEDLADQMLEEARGVTEGYKQLNQTLSESKSQLEAFMETSLLQIQEMATNIRRQEDWAASFGAYTPKIDLDMDFEAWMKEEKAKEDAEKSKKEEQESGQEKEEGDKEVEDKSEDEEEPNIFDAKLSQATMEELGYKFKESVGVKDPQHSDKNLSKPAETPANPTDDHREVEETPPNPGSTARDRSRFLDSGSSTGFDTPISILKPANSTLQQSMADASRIEITPGLVIRNPNHNRRKVPEPSPMKTPMRAMERNLTNPSPLLLGLPQRRSPSTATAVLPGTPHSAMKRKLINPPSSLRRGTIKGQKNLEVKQPEQQDDSDECPETPQLRTVSIHKMREEQKRKDEEQQRRREEEQKRRDMAEIMKTPVRSLVDSVPPHKMVTPSANWSVNQSVSTPESPEPRAALNVKKMLMNSKAERLIKNEAPSSVSKPILPRDDLTPETPELRTMNLKKHLMMKENKQQQQSSLASEESEKTGFATPHKSQSNLAASDRKSGSRKIVFEEDPFQGDVKQPGQEIVGTESDGSPGPPTPPRLRTMKL